MFKFPTGGITRLTGSHALSRSVGRLRNESGPVEKNRVSQRGVRP